MVDLERSIYDYIHNLLFSKEKIMNTLNQKKVLIIFRSFGYLFLNYRNCKCSSQGPNASKVG